MMDSVVMFQGTIYEGGYGLLARAVMRDKSLHRNSKVIYAYICSFASNSNSAERTAFPSIELQCSEIGITEDTYFKYRKPLIQKGYLKIEKQESVSGKFTKNLYIINAVVQPIEDEPKDLEEAIPEKIGYGENLDKSTSEPYPKNSGTAEPYPNSSSTVKSCAVNSGTKTTNTKTNSFKNLLVSSSSSEESIDEMLKSEFPDAPFEEVKQKALADPTATIKNLTQYEGFLRYRLSIWTPKPQKARFQPKRVTRTELLPDWYHKQDEPKQEPESQNKEDLAKKKAEIEEMLKKINE